MSVETIEYPLAQEEMKKMIDPLEKNFEAESRKFVEGMTYPQTDPKLREWILSDMSAAPPNIALSAMREMMMQYITDEAAKIFDRIRIPVVTVNGDMWPVNYEANRRHMFSYDAVILEKADHFFMMEFRSIQRCPGEGTPHADGRMRRIRRRRFFNIDKQGGLIHELNRFGRGKSGGGKDRFKEEIGRPDQVKRRTQPTAVDLETALLPAPFAVISTIKKKKRDLT